jgi:hypothetical protein
MNITEEMLNIANDLTADICQRIDLLKDILSEYEEDTYILNVVLDLMIPGHVKYDLDDEKFVYDFNSTSGFCSYLMERQKARENAKKVINAKYGMLGPSDAIYTDTDSFKYLEPAESEAKNESI